MNKKEFSDTWLGRNREIAFLLVAIGIVVAMSKFGDPALTDFIEMRLSKTVATFLLCVGFAGAVGRIAYPYFRPHRQDNGDKKWAILVRLWLATLFVACMF